MIGCAELCPKHRDDRCCWDCLDYNNCIDVCPWVNDEHKAGSCEGMEEDEDDGFKAEIITKGSFIDSDAAPGRLFLVETITLKLNHMALNEWIMSECFNTRDCYEDGETGDAQWEVHKAEYALRRKAWREQIFNTLEIDPTKRGITVTQNLSEVFTVVCVKELRGKRDERQD